MAIRNYATTEPGDCLPPMMPDDIVLDYHHIILRAGDIVRDRATGAYGVVSAITEDPYPRLVNGVMTWTGKPYLYIVFYTQTGSFSRYLGGVQVEAVL